MTDAAPSRTAHEGLTSWSTALTTSGLTLSHGWARSRWVSEPASRLRSWSQRASPFVTWSRVQHDACTLAPTTAVSLVSDRGRWPPGIRTPDRRRWSVRRVLIGHVREGFSGKKVFCRAVREAMRRLRRNADASEVGAPLDMRSDVISRGLDVQWCGKDSCRCQT